MFRILNEQLAWWPVKFAGVSEKGEIVENEIELRFVILDEDEIVEFARFQQTELTEDEKNLPPSGQAARVLARIVRDWRGVGAENGEALAFSVAGLTSLLKVPNVGRAISEAYIACRAAEPKVREGN